MNELIDLKPNMVIDDSYEGTLVLPSWKGFQSRQGFYGTQDKTDESDGTVRVTIQGQGNDQAKIITAGQVNALKFLIDNSDTVRDSILDALIEELPNLKAIYEDLMPDIIGKEDLKKIIGLTFIHIMPSDRDNHAYIGFEIGCCWDEEHGVGVMTHKNRIVAIGQADTSFNSWLTFEDNGTIEAEQQKWHEANKKLQQERAANNKKKAWWKFW